MQISLKKKGYKKPDTFFTGSLFRRFIYSIAGDILYFFEPNNTWQKNVSLLGSNTRSYWFFVYTCNHVYLTWLRDTDWIISSFLNIWKFYVLILYWIELVSILILFLETKMLCFLEENSKNVPIICFNCPTKVFLPTQT